MNSIRNISPRQVQEQFPTQKNTQKESKTYRDTNSG